MNYTAAAVKKELQQKINLEKAKLLASFFKTGKGQYGEGDVFIGLIVPEQRNVARMFSELPLEEIDVLLQSDVHEHRLTGIFILVGQFKKAKQEAERKKIYDFYLSHLSRVNNWDLVDSSASYIMGGYLFDKSSQKSKQTLQKLAHSKSLWDRRVAIIATLYFIYQDRFDETFEISEILLHDSEDLIHKAVGWALREIGKKDKTTEIDFLNKHYKTMPRTMLRYAIEKFSDKERKYYLVKTV